MRFRRLRLEHYGSFASADLSFATEPGRITLVTAPNGAGKSVLRRAFHDLLFDIPLQSPMKFRHGYPGMALHAEAIGADGAAFEFGWVRSGKPEQRVASDPARFDALLRGVSPQQLEQLFALDTAALRKGGTDLKGGTTLAGALLAGTGELAPAKAVRAAIEARRQANWGQGKSKPPLNAAASALDAARRKAMAAIQRPEARERAERDAEAQHLDHQAARAGHDRALAQSHRLHRIALTRPHLRIFAEAEAWLTVHPDAPALPPGLELTLTESQAALATAQATHDAARAGLAAAVDAAAGITEDAAAMQWADALSALPGMLGEAEKTAKDILARRADHAAEREAVRAALRDIGDPVPEHRAAAAIPALGLRAEVRAAVTEGASLHAAWDGARARAARSTREEGTAKDAPDAATALPDGLPALLDEIRADRNPVQHAADTARAAREAEAEVAALLAMVPNWPGTAAALRAVSLHAEPGFERMDAARQSAIAQHREAAQARATLARERDATSDALAALHVRPLPDAAAIAAARTARDIGLRLVLRHAFALPPDPVEDRAYAAGEPLALVFERHIRLADDLADRRMAELERVETAERLAQTLHALDQQRPAAQSAEDDAATGLARSSSDWAAACAPLGAGPDTTMAELRAILAARARVIDAMRLAEIARHAEQALDRLHEGWATRLAELLAEPAQPLAALLRQADARIASVHAALRSTADRQATLDAARRVAQEAAFALTEAEAALATWQARWDRLLACLGRPAGEHPAATAAVLEGIGILERHHQEAASLDRRITDMQADLDRFAGTVADLAAALAAPSSATPAATARLLIARADVAKSAASARNQAELTQNSARTRERDAHAVLDGAKTRLTAAIAACGADTAEAATLRLAAARARAETASRRDAARRALDEHGDGLPLAQLHAESDAVPPEDMPGRRQAADRDATEAAAHAEQAAVTLAHLRQALDAEAGATTAIEARAELEAASAQFARRLEEQLVLNVASAMLNEAMRAVEGELGETSLARVSQAFSAVTAGAYGLETHEGPDGEELHAVERAYPEEHKALDELSEGTRDQLYLALRMVALREHCKSATPLPFIADDILQTFDDDRARATLLALCTLSQDLQVIVLTHHTHLEHLAAGLSDSCVQIVRLG